MPQINEPDTSPYIPGPDDKPRPGVRSTLPSENAMKEPATPRAPVLRTFIPEPEDNS